MLFGDVCPVYLGHSRKICLVYGSLNIVVVVRRTVEYLVLFTMTLVGMMTTDIHDYRTLWIEVTNTLFRRIHVRELMMFVLRFVH